MPALKDALHSEYGIVAIVFIKVSEQLYRVQTNDGEYAIKLVKDADLNAVFAHAKLLNLDFMHFPVASNAGQYVSSCDEGYYIVYNWVAPAPVAPRAMRMQFYFNALAQLHQRSSYQISVNAGFFNETYNYVEQALETVAQTLDQELARIERLDYRAPSEWLLLLNNQQFYHAMHLCREQLEQFKKLTEHKSSIRLALVYQNFAYDHINLAARKLMATTKMGFAPPIYDLKHLYDTAYSESIDLSGFKNDYLRYFPLLPEERCWLLSLMLIPQFDFSAGSEIERIYRLTRSLHHLRCAIEIAAVLREQANHDNRGEKSDDEPH